MALEVARLGKWMVQSPRKTLRMGQTEMERTQKNTQVEFHSDIETHIHSLICDHEVVYTSIWVALCS